MKADARGSVKSTLSGESGTTLLVRTPIANKTALLSPALSSPALSSLEGGEGEIPAPAVVVL